MKMALGLLLCGIAMGQTFRHLATTDDGSRPYFSAGIPKSRDLVFDGQGAHLFAQADNEALGWPSVSGDGRIVGFSGVAGGKFQARVALGNGTVIWNYSGQASVSRNGRFALFMPEAPGLRATVVD